MLYGILCQRSKRSMSPGQRLMEALQTTPGTRVHASQGPSLHPWGHEGLSAVHLPASA